MDHKFDVPDLFSASSASSAHAYGGDGKNDDDHQYNVFLNIGIVLLVAYAAYYVLKNK